MSAKVINSNRKSATGVVGVMRRAEDRKRRQQVASQSAHTYIAEHRIPQVLDALVGRVLQEKPSEPLRLIEKLLRELDPNGLPKRNAEMPPVIPKSTGDESAQLTARPNEMRRTHSDEQNLIQDDIAELIE